MYTKTNLFFFFNGLEYLKDIHHYNVVPESYQFYLKSLPMIMMQLNKPRTLLIADFYITRALCVSLTIIT